MNKYPITPQGFKQLTDELHKLKTVDRVANIADIDEARKQGDLSENAEYSAAKEQQSLIATKIQKLETYINCAQIIDTANIFNGETVIFGVTVVLLSEGEEFCYKIVGEYEADVKINKISIMTPLARALIGKKVGDEFVIKLPNQEEREYSILNVYYAD